MRRVSFDGLDQSGMEFADVSGWSNTNDTQMR